MTAGPRITIFGHRIGRFEFFSRCFGSGGVITRWNIIARYPPGKLYWSWFVSWEPALNRSMGFSFMRSSPKWVVA